MKIKDMTDEQLIRKADQEMEMASLAMQDGDKKDYERRMKKAKEYQEELRNRQ